MLHTDHSFSSLLSSSQSVLDLPSPYDRLFVRFHSEEEGMPPGDINQMCYINLQ